MIVRRLDSQDEPPNTSDLEELQREQKDERPRATESPLHSTATRFRIQSL